MKFTGKSKYYLDLYNYLRENGGDRTVAVRYFNKAVLSAREAEDNNYISINDKATFILK